MDKCCERNLRSFDNFDLGSDNLIFMGVGGAGGRKCIRAWIFFFICDKILSFYLHIIQSVQYNSPCPGYFFLENWALEIYFRKSSSP